MGVTACSCTLCKCRRFVANSDTHVTDQWQCEHCCNCKRMVPLCAYGYAYGRKERVAVSTCADRIFIDCVTSRKATEVGSSSPLTHNQLNNYNKYSDL